MYGRNERHAIRNVGRQRTTVVCGYQQNLKVRTIALIVLGNPRWPVPHQHVRRVVARVNAATPGSYTEVEIPER